MKIQEIKYRCEEWGTEEALAILHGIVGNGAITKLQLELELRYKAPVYLLNSARSGLKIALNQCRKRYPGRKKVIVPTYICDSVPQTIAQMGLIVASAPVNEQLNLCPKALKSVLDENCLAVVMPHMYGVPADVYAIQRTTHEAKISLIDDAAQVAGIYVNGKLLGTFGDYGMLSFAQAKSIVCGVRGSGGVLFNTSGIPLEVSLSSASALSRLPKYAHFWAQYVARGKWMTLGYYVERLRNLICKERQNYYPDNKAIAESDASIALAQFRSLDRRICFAIQRAEIARKGLSKCSNILAPQFQDIPRYVTRFVIQTRLLDPARLAEGLRKIGIESRRVYGDGSRAYDGAPNSGLLELPWIGLSNPETILMIDRLCQLDPR